MSGQSHTDGHGPLSAPPLDALVLRFVLADLASVRGVVGERAAIAGIDPERAVGLVLAVNELTINSIQHAGGGGELRIWTTTDGFVCEVSDSGQILELAVGRIRPDPQAGGGYGLWLVHQLCDLVQIRSSSAGTTVRVQMQRALADPQLSAG